MRVFYDRLIDDKDRLWLFDTVKNLLKEQFKESVDGVFEHLLDENKPGAKIVEADLRSLMFGDYMNPDLLPDERVYEEVISLDEFYTVAESSLEEYNNMHKTRMNLVIFRFVVFILDTYIPFIFLNQMKRNNDSEEI